MASLDRVGRTLYRILVRHAHAFDRSAALRVSSCGRSFSVDREPYGLSAVTSRHAC